MRYSFGLIALLGMLTACSPPEQMPPTVADAWIRAAPPGAGMTAGYMTVSNPGDVPIQLIAVESGDFEKIELHTTVMDGGVARMRQETSITIPPRASIAFEPGGRHLMLFGPKRPLAVADTVTLKLKLYPGSGVEGLEPISVDVEARIHRGRDGHLHHQ